MIKIIFSQLKKRQGRKENTVNIYNKCEEQNKMLERNNNLLVTKCKWMVLTSQRNHTGLKMSNYILLMRNI